MTTKKTGTANTDSLQCDDESQKVRM